MTLLHQAAQKAVEAPLMKLADEAIHAYAGWLADFIAGELPSPHTDRLNAEKDAAREKLRLAIVATLQQQEVPREPVAWRCACGESTRAGWTHRYGWCNEGGPAEFEKSASPSTTRQQEAGNGFWWCAQCQCEVPSRSVTYEETHDVRAGGCGHPVGAAAPSTPEKAGGVSDGVKEGAEPRRWHELKTDPGLFDEVAAGRKTWEIRLDDRDYMVGDGLILRKTLHSGAQMRNGHALIYVGEPLRFVVTHVLTGYGLQDGWCGLSIQPYGVPSPIPHPLPAQANDGGEHG